MSRSSLALRLAIVVAAASWVAQAQAQPATTNSSHQPVMHPPFTTADNPAVLKNEDLRFTTISYHQPAEGVPLDAGVITALDAAPIQITCPNDTTANCIITSDATVQVGIAATVTLASICMYVDGVELLCPFIGNVPTDSWTFSSFSNVAAGVKPGKHTVQMFITTGDTAYRGLYTINYRVYKPQ